MAKTPGAASPVDLFAVQPYMTLQDYRDPDAFADHLERLGAPVAHRAHEAALVVFPEDIATFLALAAAPAGLDQVATLDDAFRLLGRRLLRQLLWTRLRHRAGSMEAAFFTAAAPAVYRAWHRTFSRLARLWGATVVAGSALLPANALGYGSDAYQARDARVLNLSLTFGPDGQVHDHTAKVNLVPTQEDRLHLAPDAAPRSVYAVGPHLVGTAICYDAFHVPHTPHEQRFTGQVPALAALGATIIAQPSANPWWWDQPWPLDPSSSGPRLRRDQWMSEGLPAAMAAAPTIRAGVNPQLLARLWDVHFDGRSMIFGRQDGTVKVMAHAPRSDAHPDSEALIHWSLTV